MAVDQQKTTDSYSKSLAGILVVGAVFTFCVLQLIIFWFILKWLWPQIRLPHYVLALLCLFVSIVLLHWLRKRKRLRSHRAFVESVAGFSEDFARSHNLMLKKNEFAGLIGFYFRHSQGGLGQIGLQKRHGEKSRVFAFWMYDDYDTSRRGIKDASQELNALEENYLHRVLTETLRQVLSWQQEDLCPVKGSLNWKEKHSRKEYERFYAKYPVPTLD